MGHQKIDWQFKPIAGRRVILNRKQSEFRAGEHSEDADWLCEDSPLIGQKILKVGVGYFLFKGEGNRRIEYIEGSFNVWMFGEPLCNKG